MLGKWLHAVASVVGFLSAPTLDKMLSAAAPFLGRRLCLIKAKLWEKFYGQQNQGIDSLSFAEVVFTRHLVLPPY